MALPQLAGLLLVLLGVLHAQGQPSPTPAPSPAPAPAPSPALSGEAHPFAAQKHGHSSAGVCCTGVRPAGRRRCPPAPVRPPPASHPDCSLPLGCSAEAELLLTFKAGITNWDAAAAARGILGWSNTSLLSYCTWSGVTCGAFGGGNLVTTLCVRRLRLHAAARCNRCNSLSQLHVRLASFRPHHPPHRCRPCNALQRPRL